MIFRKKWIFENVVRRVVMVTAPSSALDESNRHKKVDKASCQRERSLLRTCFCPDDKENVCFEEQSLNFSSRVSSPFLFCFISVFKYD